MISLLIWFALLSSGSILCTAVWGKRYEEVLPLTSSGIVLLLFLAGIMGNLFAGAVFVCAAGIGVIVFSGVWLVWKKDIRKFMQNFFTPAFGIFAFLFIMACWLNLGKMACSWDEFSHWADIVKVMTTLDDFGTNPESYSAFQSYPPAMSLFQYFLEKLYSWFGAGTFSEWRMYLAYQIFAFTFMLPFLKDLNRKKWGGGTAATLAFFLCPLVYYNTFYTQIYIDPFLGILSGAGLASVFVCKKRDALYTLRILFTCSVLVLSKDAGLFLAAVVACAYALDCCLGGKQSGGNRLWIKNCVCIIGAVLAVMLPKQLWSWHLKVSGAQIAFARAVDIKKLVEIICNRETGYQRTVWEEFYRALFTKAIAIGNTGVTVNYAVMFLISMLLLYGLVLWYKRSVDLYTGKGKLLFCMVCIQSAVYTVGLCVTYIFKFGEYEAVRLASFERYMNIALLSVGVVITMLYCIAMQRICKERAFMAFAIVVVMLLISPGEYIYDYVSRNTVEESVQVRGYYEPLNGAIQEYVTPKSRIYFVSQGTTGFDYWVMRYNVRPNTFNPNFTWSIGEPFYEGDIWTRQITAEQWQEELLEDYDYVALYKVNDFFRSQFASLFAEAEDISENSVYRINKETGLLEKCQD